MSKTNGGLKVMAPEPLGADERSPLLDHHNGRSENEDNLEAQAEQEQREYDAGTVPLPDEPSTKKLLVTMSSLWLCTFFAALDATIVATLSGPITSSFNSGTLFSWIASGYLIANAAFQPLSGKLTDIYGRRAGIVFATVFFAVGTLICGFAKEGWVMILGRVVAGSGGGCLNTISTFVASDLIPLRKRGVWQGFGNIVFGTGMGLGGVFGGAIHDSIGWRYAFFIQVPFILVGGITGFFTVDVPVKDTETDKIRRVDFSGAFALVATLVLLLLGLNSGGNIVPWTHPLVLVSLPLSAVFLLVFIYVEDRVASEPVIPVRLLLNQTVAAACLTNWFATMSVFALIYYGPIYFQVISGISATRAGTLFIPQSAGTAIGSLGSGLIMRATGKYWWLNIVIQVMMVTGCSLVLATFNATVADVPPFIYLFLIGTAYGSMLTITLISLIASVDHKYQAVITSASYAFRSTGSSIGITIASTVFQNLLKQGLFERFPDHPDEIRRIRDNVDELKHLPRGWRDGAIEAYVDAFRGVWVVVLGFAILTAFAIITGGGSGLGKATALRFADSGARIVVGDLTSNGVEKEINDKHGSDKAIFVKCDVSKEDDIANMVRKAAEWGGRLDIICNYAGITVEIGQGMNKRVHEVDVADFDKLHNINTRGVWLCCKHALGQMMKQEPRAANARGEQTRGWIVNAASMLGLVAYPNTTAYVPSKHAVVGMTKQMALDYARDRIHVNALCPGFVESPMISGLTADAAVREPLAASHPWNALGRPEDVADAAVFLCSDEAAWVTGHSMVIDGGYTIQ
ncbi:uncharacterized protein LTR77_007630 [Saxophila tyrrhenica]|uniref:Major facilitator superfamily (MFS) profile domain-containing protein n=1 Tax=Saxophila tyrrhenica TaxID=1690608 RepID=A0AAV9P2L3_9PEZI|nr:hypothetical protein LTR77_007630 [Saxophila tyrrhenica]